MRTFRSRMTLLLAVALLGSGCSGSEESDAPPKPMLSVFEPTSATPSSGEGETAGLSTPTEDREFGAEPSVDRVDFEPLDPETRARFRAVAKVSGDWSSLQYIWTLNGEKFGPNASEVVLPRLATGDVVAVRVTPYQNRSPGGALEAEAVVRNQRPQLRHLSIERVEDAGDGEETWRAAIRAEDPDEDRLEIEYRWFVNGEQSEVQEEIFPAANLRSGDRLELRARAFDGRAWSAASRSGEIVIGNSLPMIVSTPPRPGANGFFSYAVRVKDSDPENRLRFRLDKSPRGMKIDEESGLVTWSPDTDQAGRHEVEVVVRDAQGGEASQSFSLALIAVSDSGSAPAAPR